MSPEQLTLLYHESNSPITEMWPNRLYEEIMNVRVNSIFAKIMQGTMPPPVSNGLNIFSAEGDLPVHISYPPYSLAKSLARDYQKWIEEQQKRVQDPDALIKTYTFKFMRREQGFVRFFESNERVRTGTVIFSYLTPVSTFLPGTPH